MNIKQIPSLLTLLLLLSCQHSTKNADPRATRPDPASAVKPEKRTPANTIWRVSADDKPGEVYLMGTAHLQLDDAKLSPEVLKVMPKVSVIALERINDAADLDAQRKYVAKHGHLADDVKMEDVYAKEDLLHVARACALANIDVKSCLTFKPSLLVFDIQREALRLAGYKVEQGGEALLKKEAAKRVEAEAKQAVDDEPPQEQTLSSQTPSQKQAPSLQAQAPSVQKASIKMVSLETPKQMFGALLSTSLKAQAFWMRRTLEGLYGLPRRETLDDARFEKQISEALLKHRNENLAVQMEKLLSSEQTSIAAIGGAHLQGEESVLTYLRRHGLHLKPIAVEENVLLSRFLAAGEITGFEVEVLEKALESEPYSSAEVVDLGGASVIFPGRPMQVVRKKKKSGDVFIGGLERFGVLYNFVVFALKSDSDEDEIRFTQELVVKKFSTSFKNLCDEYSASIKFDESKDLVQASCKSSWSTTSSRFEIHRKQLNQYILTIEISRPAKSEAEEQQRALEVERFFNSFATDDVSQGSSFDGIWVSDWALTTKGLDRFKVWPGETRKTFMGKDFFGHLIVVVNDRDGVASAHDGQCSDLLDEASVENQAAKILSTRFDFSKHESYVDWVKRREVAVSWVQDDHQYVSIPALERSFGHEFLEVFSRISKAEALKRAPCLEPWLTSAN